MTYKVFRCITEHVGDIQTEVSDRGIVLFQETGSVVKKFYQEELQKDLSASVYLLYTNHKTEGYFYFLLDIDRINYEEAKESIKDSNLLFKYN